MYAVKSRHARGLLHIVRHDHDRVIVLQLRESAPRSSPSKSGRAPRTARRAAARPGLTADRARDAQPLLLAAGQRHPALFKLVLDLVPQRGLRQRPLDRSSIAAVPSDSYSRTPKAMLSRSTSGTVSASGTPSRLWRAAVQVDAGVEHVLAVERDLARSARCPGYSGTCGSASAATSTCRSPMGR